MIRVYFAIVLILISAFAFGQDKFFTKAGSISFFSKTQLEDIDAHNRSVTCVLDSKTGNVQFAVLMKGFEFKKALMQEHFNEDYVESDIYPRAEFKGVIIDNNKLDYTKEGVQQVRVRGQLTIHGQTNQIETDGTLSPKDGKIFITSEFPVTIADYKISVAAFAKNKVSKTITVKVSCALEPLR